MNQDFAKKIIALAGEEGKKWLEELPKTIKFYENKWQLKCFSPFTLSYNYVCPAESTNGDAFVIKISFPNNNEFLDEMNALKFYNGDGSIRVIREDLTNGVVLLEKAVPGTRIGNIQPDEKQISTVSELVRKIHKPISQLNNFSFKTLNDWAKAFERYRQNFDMRSGPVPLKMLDEAEEIFIQHSIDDQVLLHGDLHNDNILLSERGWLVIDPKGVIGDRAFDVGTYLRNPYTDLPENSNYKHIVENRIIQFSEELRIDKRKIQKWAFANAIISLLWFLEDEKKFNEIYLRNAELINEIKL